MAKLTLIRAALLAFYALGTGVSAFAATATPGPASPGLPPPPVTEIRSGYIMDINPATTTLEKQGDKLLIKVKDAAGQITVTEFPLESVKKGQKFYHWTSDATPDRWVQQGGLIKPDELDYLSTPGHVDQVNGPGWYISSSPVDSAPFGTRAVETEMTKDFYMVKTRLRPADKAAADRIFAALKGQEIYGTEMYNGTWHAVFDEVAASKITYFNPKDALDSLMTAAEKNPNLAGDGALPEIMRVVGYQKHPFYAKYYPEFDRMMSGALQPGDIDTLTAKYFQAGLSYDSVQKKIWSALPPANRSNLIAQLLPATSNANASLSGIVQIDQTLGGLPAGDLLAKNYPDLANLLTGKPLTDHEHELIAGYLNNGLLDSIQPSSRSPLMQRLQGEFAPEIRRHFADQLAVQAAVPGQEYVSENSYHLARSWGVHSTLLDAASQDPGHRLLGGATAAFAESRRGLDTQGRNLVDSYGFLSEEDIARSLANGDNQPWKALDKAGQTPFIDRWHQTLAKKSGNTADYYARLTGSETAKFRDLPLVTGGDVVPAGSTVGYLRLTQDRLNILKQNPLLKVEAIPEAASGSGVATFLVRYEHPSARTFHQFSNLLSPSLQADLAKAEAAGLLADPANATTRDLTSQVLRELTNNQLNSPLSEYQRMVALQPFDKDNDVFARFWYSRQTGGQTVLVLKDPRKVLTSTPFELAATRDEGDRQLERITAALRRVHDNNPAASNYGDIPEVYESFFHSPVSIGNKAEHQAAMKAFFADNANATMLRNGQIGQLETKAWDLEVGRLANLPADQKTTVLREWARAGLRPEPASETAFRKLLDDSRAAATGTDRDMVTTWWLELANGGSNRHASTIADFSASLSPDFRARIVETSVRNRIGLGAAATPELNQEAMKTAARIASVSTDPDRFAANHFVLQNLLDHPSNPKVPLGDVIRKLNGNLKGNDGALLIRDLLTQSNPEARGKFLHALIELPPDSLSPETASYALSFWPTLTAKDQVEIMNIAVRNPDSKFAIAAWQAVGSKAGYPDAAQLLSDPQMQAELRKRIAESPESATLFQGIVAFASLDPKKEMQIQLGLFQSLSQKKAYDPYFGMLLNKDAQAFPDARGLAATDKDWARYVKEMRRELQQIAKDSPQNASLAYYYESKLVNPDEVEALRKATIQELPQARPEAMPLLLDRIMQDRVRGIAATNKAEILNNVTADIIGSGPEPTRVLLKNVLTADELAHLAPDAGSLTNLITSLSGMPVDARAESLLKILNSNPVLSDGVIQKILASGNKDLIGTLTMLAGARPSSSWLLAVRFASVSDDATRRAFVHSFGVSRGLRVASDEDTDRLAKLIASMKESPAPLLAPDAASFSVQTRVALLQERDLSGFAYVKSYGDPDFQAKVRETMERLPKTPAEIKEFRAAFALAPLDTSDAAGVARKSVDKLLGELAQPGVSAELQKKLANEALGGIVIQLNASGAKLPVELADAYLEGFDRIKGADTILLLRMISRSSGYDQTLLTFFGNALLSDKPEIIREAVAQLAKFDINSSNIASFRSFFAPYLVKFVQKNGDKSEQLLKPLTATLQIDYKQDYAKYEHVAPAVVPAAAPSSCPTAFAAIKP